MDVVVVMKMAQVAMRRSIVGKDRSPAVVVVTMRSMEVAVLGFDIVIYGLCQSLERRSAVEARSYSI